jgi:hypothetical protein
MHPLNSANSAAEQKTAPPTYAVFSLNSSKMDHVKTGLFDFVTTTTQASFGTTNSLQCGLDVGNRISWL